MTPVGEIQDNPVRIITDAVHYLSMEKTASPEDLLREIHADVKHLGTLADASFPAIAYSLNNLPTSVLAELSSLRLALDKDGNARKAHGAKA